MNYLVHLYLSVPDPEVRLGNLLGDWVKGRLDPNTWPSGVLLGLQQHRTIDRISQTSPAVKRSKARIDERFCILKPVMVDIFYDHILAADWDDFHDQPLTMFTPGIYRLFHTYRHLLPEAFLPIGERMAAHDWLVSYRQKETVPLVLRKISERLKRTNILGEGGDELFRQRDGFRKDFELFLQEAKMALKAEYPDTAVVDHNAQLD